MSLNDLSPVQKLALRAVVPDKLFKAVKPLVRVGDHQADFMVRIAGLVRLGKDYEQSIALTFPWQRLALMLATRVPRHVLDAVLRDLRKENSIDDLKAHVYAIWAEIQEATEQRCAGKVTSELSVEVLKAG